MKHLDAQFKEYNIEDPEYKNAEKLNFKSEFSGVTKELRDIK